MFDEIEKAHPDFFKIILNLLDKGEITDNRGDRVSFKNSLIVFTTNIGTDYETGKESGLGFIKTKSDTGKDILKEMKNVFRPEFMGRLDKVIVFENLTNDIADQLIDRYLEIYNNKMKTPIKFTKADRKEIIDSSDIVTEGARNIRKVVKDQIVKKIQRKEK